MPAVRAIAAARKPGGHEGRSGDLIKPLIVYALLSLIAATRRPVGAGRSVPTDRLSDGGRPATGAFGTTRSTDEPRSVQPRSRQRGWSGSTGERAVANPVAGMERHLLAYLWPDR